jgi:peroxiredoxin
MLKKIVSLAPWMLVTALLISNLLLLGQNRKMRGVIEAATPRVLRPGDKVPEFAAPDLNNQRVDIRYNAESPRRIFLFFKPSCPYCQEQFPYWKAILEQASKAGLEVWGLAGDEQDKARLQDYLAAMGCVKDGVPLLRVALVSKEMRESYKLHSTPTTLVVSSDGRIEKAWLGRWDAMERLEAFSFLEIQFQP